MEREVSFQYTDYGSACDTVVLLELLHVLDSAIKLFTIAANVRGNAH